MIALEHDASIDHIGAPEDRKYGHSEWYRIKDLMMYVACRVRRSRDASMQMR